MTAKHTPGPWKWEGDYQNEAISPGVVTLGDDGACGDPECCDDGPSFHIEITEADARLIEAAPDLLAALVDCQPFIDGKWIAVRRKADAAIAKAEGTP